MRELQSGVWWWEAVHPDWTAEDDAAGRDWGPEVSSYAVDDGERLLLIDPPTPPAPILDVGACLPSSSPTCPCRRQRGSRSGDELAQSCLGGMADGLGLPSSFLRAPAVAPSAIENRLDDEVQLIIPHACEQGKGERPYGRILRSR